MVFTSPPTSTSATAALARRLAALQDLLATTGPRATGEGVHLFDALADLVQGVEGRRDLAWLLVTGLTGAMPDQPLVHAVARNLALRDPDAGTLWLLDVTAVLARDHGNVHADLALVADRPVVDVSPLLRTDGPAGGRHDQRAVFDRWTASHEVTCVTWTPRDGAYRAIADADLSALLERSARQRRRGVAARAASREPTRIVVPWGVPVVVLDVPDGARSDRLAALAELTTASLRLVGHGCEPVSSAESTDLAESAEFCRYLEVVKHADRVAAVSRIAAAELSGFVRALGSQGVPGPEVRVCPLPTSEPAGASASPPPDAPGSPPRLVAWQGVAGRRDNLARVVQAAELLWGDGLDFALTVLARRGAAPPVVADLLTELGDRGRPVTVELDPSDARVASSVAQARGLVLPTLHAGCGAALTTALTRGVPVVTSDFGVGREIAEGRGGLLVDPTDVDALAAALHTLLTDDAVHADLVSQARDRPVQAPDQYADELWEALLA